MAELSPPPDESSRIKMLEWRAAAAETALLGIVEQYRETLAHWGPIAQQFVVLNNRYPLAHPRTHDTTEIAFTTLRADSAYAALSDDQLRKLIKDART
jgi:hypothetical protein